MRKKIIAGFVLLSLSSANVFAGECDWVPGYDYRLGHKSVRTSDLLSRYYSNNVVVCIGSDTPSSWIFPLHNAINRLNNQLSETNSHLRFSGNNYYQNCTVYVTSGYDPNDTRYAAIDSPATPGMYFGINTARNPGNNSWKTYIAMHELLHAVGVGHPGVPLTGPWIEVPGTDGRWSTSRAGNSIMCSETGPSPILDLNSLDVKTLEYMYPN